MKNWGFSPQGGEWATLNPDSKKFSGYVALVEADTDEIVRIHPFVGALAPSAY